MIKLNKTGKKKYGKYLSKKIPNGICGTWYLCGKAADLVNNTIEEVKRETKASQYSKQSAIQMLLEEMYELKNVNQSSQA